MDHTTLGRTGLKVSVACLGGGGSSKLGKGQGASFEHSVSVVKAALDEGVNFLDTAAAYGTETIVGEAIKGNATRSSSPARIYARGRARRKRARTS